MNVNGNNKFAHRTAVKTLKLVREDGSPIKNKEILFEQKKHKFLFGCNGFDAVPLASGLLKDEKKELIEERYRKFLDIFNSATLPFYWGRFEPEKGKPQTEALKKASQWLIDHGCTIKGHPLCWHTVTAPWLLDMTTEEILAAQLDRIRRDVTDFKGIIDMWDVINEVVIMPIFDKYDNGIIRICKQLGRISTVREMFVAAKEANPDATLLINDFNTTTSYEILVEGCLESGIPIDVIGIQSHMHQGYWGVEKTLEVLERFSHFNLPIHFTENTIVSGHIMPPEIEDLNDYKLAEWPTTPEGEDRQAREVVQHYRTLFEHTLVESITWWDFVEVAWLGAPSGFLRRDNSSKPAYDAIRELIRNEWWTKPTRVATDESGEVTVTGFLGDYELTCESKKAGFVLDKADKSQTIVLL